MPMVLGVCRRLVGSEAEDAVQAIFPMVVVCKETDLAERAAIAACCAMLFFDLIR